MSTRNETTNMLEIELELLRAELKTCHYKDQRNIARAIYSVKHELNKRDQAFKRALGLGLIQ